MVIPHRRKSFRPVVDGAPPITYLINQNFETPTTGYDNGETWTEAAVGTVEAANTGTVIVGAQSLQIALVSNSGSTYSEFADQTTLFCKFRFRVASTNSGNQTIATIRNGASVLGTIQLAGANRVLRAIVAGGANTNSSAVLPVDTDIYIWFEYVKGTLNVSNAICRAGWSSDGIKPSLATTSTNSAVSTVNATTSDANRLYLGNTANGVIECFYDAVQIASNAF